jgi:hypothetical protein
MSLTESAGFTVSGARRARANISRAGRMPARGLSS